MTFTRPKTTIELGNHISKLPAILRDEMDDEEKIRTAINAIKDANWAVGFLGNRASGITLLETAELRDSVNDMILGGMDLRNKLNAILADANIRRMRNDAERTGGDSDTFGPIEA